MPRPRIISKATPSKDTAVPQLCQIHRTRTSVWIGLKSFHIPILKTKHLGPGLKDSPRTGGSPTSECQAPASAEKSAFWAVCSNRWPMERHLTRFQTMDHSISVVLVLFEVVRNFQVSETPWNRSILLSWKSLFGSSSSSSSSHSLGRDWMFGYFIGLSSMTSINFLLTSAQGWSCKMSWNLSCLKMFVFRNMSCFTLFFGVAQKNLTARPSEAAWRLALKHLHCTIQMSWTQIFQVKCHPPANNAAQDEVRRSRAPVNSTTVSSPKQANFDQRAQGLNVHWRYPGSPEHQNLDRRGHWISERIFCIFTTFSNQTKPCAFWKHWKNALGKQMRLIIALICCSALHTAPSWGPNCMGSE